MQFTLSNVELDCSFTNPHHFWSFWVFTLFFAFALGRAWAVDERRVRAFVGVFIWGCLGSVLAGIPAVIIDTWSLPATAEASCMSGIPLSLSPLLALGLVIPAIVIREVLQLRSDEA